MSWMQMSAKYWDRLIENGWVAFMVYILLGWLACMIVKRLFRPLISNKRMPTQLFRVLKKVIRCVIWALVLVQGLRAVGVDVVSILGAAGVMGVAIGFASQTSLSNLISGIFLISERSFKLGDYIKVEGEEGTVDSINLLSIYLRRPDNSLVRVPCETLIKNPVTNVTGSPRRRIDIDLGVDYNSDLTQVKRVIEQIINNDADLLNDPAPIVQFSGFGDSSLNLHIGAWCKTEVYHGLRYKLATDILEAFRKEGINIPFPVRTVMMSKE